MRRHPRLALIQLLQEMKAGMEPAEPRPCWWFQCPSILSLEDLFGIPAAALAQALPQQDLGIIKPS